ncbi:DapH/DapD/GlmU-related protein, partial [Klebsiella pneumoniae]|uniref:DapH/DapD/GlmU-related protein n=1 Tax=Klebsiella pneumoniae TaxID=573 RepID=UPI003EDF1910
MIGKNAFIGTHSTLVAPVTIGDGAFLAAGSAITQDVPADALAIARAHQNVKEGWAVRRRAEQQAQKSRAAQELETATKTGGEP